MSDEAKTAREAIGFHYGRVKGNFIGVICNKCGKATTKWPYTNWADDLNSAVALKPAQLIRKPGWIVNYDDARRSAFYLMS